MSDLVLHEESHDDAMLREYLRLEGALANLGEFRAYMEESGHADFALPHPRHLQILVKALEQLEAGEFDRLMITMPPGSAKSTLMNQFKVWYAARHPDAQILCVSATSSLSETFGRRCRAAIQTPEWERLSGTSIHTDQQSVAGFGYGKTGSQVSLGVGSSVIGRRADLVALDDYCQSFEEVSNDARRQQVFSWYQAELKSRLRPGGKVVAVGTRWHASDLFGEILRSSEAGTWKHIRLPMLADSPDDEMGRELNAPLWDSWFTDRMIEEAQADALRWSCMYQCLPLTDDGDWLDPSNLPIVDSYPKGMQFFGAADIALTDGAGDFTVILIAGMDTDRRMHIVDCYRDRVTPDKIVEEMMRLHEKWKLADISLDNDNASKTLQSLAHEMMRQKGCFVPLRLVPMNGQDKETRASAFRGLALQDGVRLLKAPWNVPLLQEVDVFPRTGGGIHDDFPDTLGLLAKSAARRSSGRTTKKKAPEPIKGAITATASGWETTATLGELFGDREEALNAAMTYPRI